MPAVRDSGIEVQTGAWSQLGAEHGGPMVDLVIADPDQVQLQGGTAVNIALAPTIPRPSSPCEV